MNKKDKDDRMAKCHIEVVAFADKDTMTVGRNIRSVWQIATHPYSGRATLLHILPPWWSRASRLARLSAAAAPAAGNKWVRITEHTRLRRPELPKDDPRYRPSQYSGAYEDINGKGDAGYATNTTLGWRPDCECGLEPVPCTVLDPFSGAATPAWCASSLPALRGA